MFGDNTTKRLLAIEDELRAQKSAGPFNGGALNVPSMSPEQTWSGFVSNSNNQVTARWVATFTRSDGIDEPPMVDFAWDFSLGKTYYQDMVDDPAGYATSVSGRDKRAIDESKFIDYPQEVGPNFVKWSVDINPDQWWYYSASGTTVNLTVQAISTVIGTLALVRVI